jgi:hypothetical protein
MYATSDGEFVVATRQLIRGGSEKTGEITLTRRLADTDAATVAQGYFNNSVTLAFTTNTSRVGTDVDIPLLRSALLALVDPALQSRIINGEH